MKIKLVSCMILVALVGVALAGEPMVANPEYDNWASFDVDTSIKMKSVTEAGGTTNEMAMTTTMTSKDDEKLVLSTAMTVSVPGQEMELDPTEREVLAEVPESQAEVETPEGVTVTELDSGTEEITVEAGTFECQFVKTETEMEGMTTVSTVWMCDDVPGHMVKMVSHVEMAQGMVTDTTMELVEMTTGE